MLVSSKDYDSIPKYIEASDHHFKILELAGFYAVNKDSYNSYIEEIDSYRLSNILIYKQFFITNKQIK